LNNVLHVQICYMLGGCGHSFVIGFGRKPPRCPHHRDSALTMEQSGDWEKFNARGPNPNEVTGGLCGGPLLDGTWKDDRGDYKGNEVALDYNAALVIGVVQCLVATAEAPPPNA
jgi:endoglucanase